jgi:hypothetical protein
LTPRRFLGRLRHIVESILAAIVPPFFTSCIDTIRQPDHQGMGGIPVKAH